MNFDNFIEERNKRDLRLGLIAVPVFILVFAGFSFWLFASRPDPHQIEQKRLRQSVAIMSADEARRKRVEELCSSLPRPEKFQFSDKEIKIESEDLALVRYTFKSARDWDEIMPTFLVWLNANDWKSLPDNQTTFTKGNQTIAFSKVLGDSVNFEIFCSEKPAENGN